MMRKFRWGFEGDLPAGKLDPIFVKLVTRSSLDIESEKLVTVMIWGTESKFLEVIDKSVYKEQNDVPQEMLGTFKLTLYDGCGVALEEWELKEAYISKLNLMELDYSSTISGVELTVKYKDIKYKSLMGMKPSLSGKEVTCPECKHKFPYEGIVF